MVVTYSYIRVGATEGCNNSQVPVDTLHSTLLHYTPTGSDACSSSNPVATVGKKMILSCSTLASPCYSQVYEWYLINGTQNTTLLETTNSLTMSENVSAVDDVGGLMYECRCHDGTSCTSFRIGGMYICMHETDVVDMQV